MYKEINDQYKAFVAGQKKEKEEFDKKQKDQRTEKVDAVMKQLDGLKNQAALATTAEKAGTKASNLEASVDAQFTVAAEPARTAQPGLGSALRSTSIEADAQASFKAE